MRTSSLVLAVAVTRTGAGATSDRGQGQAEDNIMSRTKGILRYAGGFIPPAAKSSRHFQARSPRDIIISREMIFSMR